MYAASPPSLNEVDVSWLLRLGSSVINVSKQPCHKSQTRQITYSTAGAAALALTSHLGTALWAGLVVWGHCSLGCIGSCSVLRVGDEVCEVPRWCQTLERRCRKALYIQRRSRQLTMMRGRRRNKSSKSAGQTRIFALFAGRRESGDLSQPHVRYLTGTLQIRVK